MSRRSDLRSGRRFVRSPKSTMWWELEPIPIVSQEIQISDKVFCLLREAGSALQCRRRWWSAVSAVNSIKCTLSMMTKCMILNFGATLHNAGRAYGR